jgi:Asp-tRNA(Asn)/Glu-tRNA(Gln) amidotransferase A subunit family amidase
MNFKDLSLIEIIKEIKSGKTDKESVFNYFLDRIEKYDGKIKSYNFVNKEGLRKSSDDSILA